MQIGKAARSNGSHIKSRLKMEPHGVFKEVTKQCTNKDHYQSDVVQLVIFGALSVQSRQNRYSAEIEQKPRTQACSGSEAVLPPNSWLPRDSS
jgi:hypothetical protein